MACIGIAAILISFTFLASNITIIHAQQQGDQQVISQPSTIEIMTTAEAQRTISDCEYQRAG
jgi:hypothetical protein